MRMDWTELDVLEPDPDAEVPGETETNEPVVDAPDQESGDSPDDAAETDVGDDSSPEDPVGEDLSDEETDDAEADDEETDADVEETDADAEETDRDDLPEEASISDNTIIFPEGYDLTSSAAGDTAAVVEAIETQTSYICNGFAAVSFLLGVMIGMLFVYGFRIRRV